jgi:predicted O-methyltransferase YrrM
MNLTGSSAIRNHLVKGALGRLLLVPYRAFGAIRVVARPTKWIGPWLIRSREYTSWTYHLSDRNLIEACNLVSILTSRPLEEVLAYKEEILRDADLATHVKNKTLASRDRWCADEDFKIGRRILYYLIARARKPRVVVEAGVDKGLGAALICRALQKNRLDGSAGTYVGVDIHELNRAFLFSGTLASEGVLEREDAVTFLQRYEGEIDFYVHDTTPAPQHVQALLTALWPKLSPRGVLCTSWATSEVIDYVVGKGRFLTFAEEPRDHWYPGSKLLVASREDSNGTRSAKSAAGGGNAPPLG